MYVYIFHICVIYKHFHTNVCACIHIYVFTHALTLSSALLKTALFSTLKTSPQFVARITPVRVAEVR